MEITHGHRFDFNRDFYAVEVSKDGQVDIKIQKLNIFQRALRYLFGAYSSTIWSQSKSEALKAQNPKAWKQIEAHIENGDVFKSVFKVEKTSERHLPKQQQAASSKPPKASSSWKDFGKEQLQKELQAIGFTCGESIENGDCFFDSCAQLLTKATGKAHTAESIRADIAKYLKREDIPHERYQKLLKANQIDVSSYEEYKKNIGNPAKEVPAPIWGDDLAIQIVCDLYRVKMDVHAAFLLDVALIDTLEEGQYEGYDYYFNPATHSTLVSTKLDTKEFRPSGGESKMTLHVAHTQYGPWGHFMPAFAG